MQSSVQKESDVNPDIIEALLYINDITLQIKRELRMILGLLKDDGPLYTAVDKANKTLSLKAQEVGINVPEIMSEIDDGNELQLDSPNLCTLLGVSKEIPGSIDSQNIAE